MAVVLDEYGGMVGIVTLNDLIEELVGELSEDITGRYSCEPRIEKINDTSWKIFGNIALSEIEEEAGVDFGDEDYDTLTGLVFDIIGYIPQDGDQDIDVETAHLHIHVSRIEDHQIEEAVVERKPEEEPESEQKDEGKK